MGSHRSHVLLTSQKFLWSLHQPTSFSQSPSFQNLCSFSFNFQRFWTADWLALTSFWRSSIVLCLLLFNIFTGLFWTCIVIKVGRWRGRKERDGSRRFNRSAEIGEEAAGGSGGMEVEDLIVLQKWAKRWSSGEVEWEECLKNHSYETQLWNTNWQTAWDTTWKTRFAELRTSNDWIGNVWI